MSYAAEYRKLRDRLLRLTAAHRRPEYAARLGAQAAKLFADAIQHGVMFRLPDGGPFTLDLLGQMPDLRHDTLEYLKWHDAWVLICASLNGIYPERVPIDGPQDWRERAEEYANVCELLAETVIENAQPDTASNDANLNDAERYIVQAIGNGTMTAEQLARKAGYPNNSSLRATLAAMKRRGILKAAPHKRGYQLA
jgi:hypothetical protein